MALASASLFEAEKLGLELTAVIIDHGLQAGSDRVARRVAKRLTRIGFSNLLIKKVRVGKTGGPEAAARAARYQALEQIRQQIGASFILLGHTLNDQAETVLLGLVRGSGARSIAGMRERNEHQLRPLLAIERSQTLEFCKASGITIWQDPQNNDPRFLRVLLRKRVLPFLEKNIGPGVARALVRTADQLREEDDYLSGQTAKTLARLSSAGSNSLSFAAADLAKLDIAIRNRVIKAALDSFGATASRGHVLAVADLVIDWHGQKPLALPGVRVERKGKTIYFYQLRSSR